MLRRITTTTIIIIIIIIIVRCSQTLVSSTRTSLIAAHIAAKAKRLKINI